MEIASVHRVLVLYVGGTIGMQKNIEGGKNQQQFIVLFSLKNFIIDLLNILFTQTFASIKSGYI